MRLFRVISLSLVMLSVAGSTAMSAAAASVPFSGRGTNTIVGQEVLSATSVRLTAIGQGNALHLGRYQRDEELNLNPGTGTFAGWVRFTAADGDELYCTTEGGFVSATDAVGTYTIAGGTGRFANATGNANFTASLVDPVHFNVTFQGTLNN
jgi:hypothetical protein